MGTMSPRPLHVTFVCSGNICRSPMGHVILQRMVDDAGLSDDVQVSSSGTGDWHVGEHADPRTVEVLARHGYDGSRHRAREFDPDAVAAGPLETGDPWYGGAEHCARCFAEVEAACRGILLHIKDQLDS